MNKIKKIKKRNGEIKDFDQNKITSAIFNAAQSVGGRDFEQAKKISQGVIEELNSVYSENAVPSVEEIQDTVEKVLIKMGHANTAKAYILYRNKRSGIRKAKLDILGKVDDSKLTVNGILIAKARYLLKDNNGDCIETPTGMFQRVARVLSEIERKYGKNEDQVQEIYGQFYEILSNLEFIPGGRTLAGSGTKHSQLSNCFVLPVEDSMEGIFQAVLEQALVQKVGGGTGFSFSRLRPKGTRVVQADGVASGPVSFIHVFDAATEVIRQGGNRRGANMGSLSIDHPDILDFITAKDKSDDVLKNFNISVEISEKFMEAVINNQEYDLVDPKTKEPTGSMNARKVFDLLVTMAWKNGDPGLLFMDRVNRDNPCPKLGRIETTNPCGEQPLLPYEACNLGSINLSLFVKDNDVDWERLKHVTKISVRLLDNVVDASQFPIEKISHMVRYTRRIGLGVLGWGDLLYELGIPYDSDEAITLADKVMGFIQRNSHEASRDIGADKGCFPAWDVSVWNEKGIKMRNSAVTTIAPTGTLSMLAETSGGIEPNFAIAYIKRVMDGTEIVYVNRVFERVAKERGFYSEDLMRKVAKRGTLHGMDEIPEEVRRVFVTAHDITPKWHVSMQAAFQKNIDNACSKTVNFPNNATIKEVEDVYLDAYKQGCKGVTVYRDGSKSNQVLNIESVKGKTSEELKKQASVSQLVSDLKKNQETLKVQAEEGKCPECGTKMVISEGCSTCPNCAYSKCTV
ncbi:adenosylcobalamin-dependent ribonucleoside-diphosphate reductase [Nanoarchaeota archaeon]